MDKLLSPIFVIGSYRSGTSILTWCIGQHENIVPLEETNWIAYLAIYLDALYELGTENKEHSNLSAMNINCADFYEHFGLAVNSLFVGNYKNYIASGKARALNNPKLGTKNIKIARHNAEPKQRWIDGTPENAHFVYGLDRLFPSSKFLHLIRNPKQVARSLMNFSTMGSRDYEENEAYRAWKRLVDASLNAEKAFGSDRVRRVYYDDMVNSPRSFFEQCLNFVGEDFSEACLAPLSVKLNSSTYDQTFDSSIEANIDSGNEYEREAFALYKQLVGGKSLFYQPDNEKYLTVKSEFEEFSSQFRLRYIDGIRGWAQRLDAEITDRDRRIVQLQNEVRELGAWGKNLDLEIVKYRKRIAELEKGCPGA